MPPRLRRFRPRSRGRATGRPVLQLVIGRQRLRWHYAQHAAVHHHRDVAGHSGGDTQILLDEQNRDIALLGQAAQHIDELVDDDRGQSFGRFVHDQQLRIGEKRPADRQHLLLATGKLRPAIALALGQTREGLIDTLHRPGAIGSAAGQAQMLIDAERGPDAAALGHVADAEVDDFVGRESQVLRARQSDAAGARRNQAQHRVAQRRLAHAVASDHAEHTAIEPERDALEGMGMAVIDMEIVDLDDRRIIPARGGISHAGLPDRCAGRRDRPVSPPACHA